MDAADTVDNKIGRPARMIVRYERLVLAGSDLSFFFLSDRRDRDGQPRTTTNRGYSSVWCHVYIEKTRLKRNEKEEKENEREHLFFTKRNGKLQ